MAFNVHVTDEAESYFANAAKEKMGDNNIVAYATTATITETLSSLTYEQALPYLDAEVKSDDQPTWFGPGTSTPPEGGQASYIQSQDWTVTHTGATAKSPYGLVVVDEDNEVVLFVTNDWIHGIMFPGQSVNIYITLRLRGS
jgi:hypothetical protein